MLSRRVIAYYGLMGASESLPAAYGFAAGAAAPKENGLRWKSRGSPIYSAGLCSRAAFHTRGGLERARGGEIRVRLTVSSSSVLAFTPVSRLLRHIRSFEAAGSLIPKSTGIVTARELASPPFRGRFTLSSPTRSPSISVEYDYVDNSQFPRPDFHRRSNGIMGCKTPDFPAIRSRVAWPPSTGLAPLVGVLRAFQRVFALGFAGSATASAPGVQPFFAPPA